MHIKHSLLQPKHFSAAGAIVSHWDDQRHVKRNPGAMAEEVETFEQKHNVQLPIDFAEYIRLINGMLGSDEPSWEDVDDEGFIFYPFSDMYQAEQCAGYFVFCESLIVLLPFAICLSATEHHGRVVSPRGQDGHPHHVSDTFAEFIELYIADADGLYKCGPAVDACPLELEGRQTS